MNIPSSKLSIKVRGGSWKGAPAMTRERQLRIGVFCNDVSLMEQIVTWMDASSYKDRMQSYYRKELTQYTREMGNEDLSNNMQIEELVE